LSVVDTAATASLHSKLDHPTTSDNRECGSGATAAPTTTTPCVGLSVCPTPPPDAEGNPACNYRDGWDADPSGSGINVYYLCEPSGMWNPEQVTAEVRMKDGIVMARSSQIQGRFA
jgi:hypothetical protein